MTADPSPSAVRGLPQAHFALKHDFAFLVADALGDVHGDRDGLFVDDTRMLSSLALRLGGRAPALLGSGLSEDNVVFTANVTNRPLPELGGYAPPEGVVHLERTRFLWRERLHEQLVLTNYGERPVSVPLSLSFAADFADIFEVRGMTRARRGEVLAPQVSRTGVVLSYRGLDEVIRRTCIAFSQAPDAITAGEATFAITLTRRDRFTLFLEIGPDTEAPPGRNRFRAAAARARLTMRGKRRRGARLTSSGRQFDAWLGKSRADLALLETELATGPYPFAGIPWFSTPFGRDGIVTALQVLWLDPAIARGVLRFLADNQAHERSAFQDSAPGKVLHEVRRGEMAMLGEVPFRRYYGGVDTTPLFVMLAGAYAARTGDMALVDELWPALRLAMDWIEGAGDSNGDGFVDYQRAADTGLANQGWKDSVDSVFHADGHMPDGPIALVEVQGYAYAALLSMADLAERRGERKDATRWRARAGDLQRAVESRFWDDELGVYGIALDGHGALCRVATSNSGQLLYTGLPSPSRAARVCEALGTARFDNGWGIRTLAHGSPRYNPMSYHDGSVWPHDTALCAAGMARYGERMRAEHVLTELYDAAAHFGMRLPELFCGFTRRAGAAPVGYPVACLPQAWSSGAPFMLLQACLGITVDGWRREVRIDRPRLPREIHQLCVRRLPVGDATVDLVFERIEAGTTAAAMGRVPDGVRVVVNL